MGKPKGKGPKTAVNENPQDLSVDLLPAVRPGSPLRAADGHNVDGWADDDIRTYNDLLTERAKLEKEKNELEQKSSRHQTQRALLDENATALDSLFKAQMGGDFKFTGSGKCCLDFDAACEGAGKDDFPCKHELCTRAKSKGVSWMEMDTIKYYHTRIVSEKSQRMQSALRKQRDVELVRVKKDDEEEAAMRARRNAILDKATRDSHPPVQPSKSDKGITFDTGPLALLPAASKNFLLDPKNSAILDAAKENEHIVRRIRGRLDKIRHDVNAGRVSPADARVKLDQANSEMAEAERKNNEFRQMILDAEPALSQLQQPTTAVSGSNGPNIAAPASLTTVLQNTLASSNADAFSQALSVMKGFFSASDPHDVQTAIADLRSVLELNGPMSPVLQKSFRALEDMLAKPNAKGFTVDVTTSDGKTRTCNNVVEVMMNLRLKMQGSENPSAAIDPDLNLDEDTIKANLECIKVEDAAKKDMLKIAERLAEDTVETVTTALKKIKAKAILKSPIPPLSDLVLDDVITDVLLRRSVKALMVEAEASTSMPQLSGKLTALIISTARNKPEKYLATLKSARDCISTSKKPPPEILLEAVSKVDVSMAKFVAAHEEKVKKNLAAAKPPSSIAATASVPAASSSKPLVETKFLLEGSLFDSIEYEGFLKFLTSSCSTDNKQMRARVYDYYHRNLEEGIWDMLRAVVLHPSYPGFFFGDYKLEKSCCLQNLQVAAATHEPKLADTVSRFQQLGMCPARAAILVAQRMTLQIRDNFEVAKDQIIALKTLFTNCESGSNKDWIRSFNFIAQTMADMFGMLVYSLVGEDAIDVPIMGADILGFICTFVLGSIDANSAETNLRIIEKFILYTLIEFDSHSENFKKLQDVFSRFVLMCQDSARFRCLPDHTCQTRFCIMAGQKVVPAPLNVNKKDKLPQENGAPVSLDQAISGLPRDARLQFQVSHYWQLARDLTPHLRCIANNNKKCACTPADQGFAEEIQLLKNDIDVSFAQLSAFIAEGKTPPKRLWDSIEGNAAVLNDRPKAWPGNEKRLQELRSKGGKSQFKEHFSPPVPPSSLPGADGSESTLHHLNLKQVSVKVPSIQESISSSTSHKGRVEKDTAKASSSQRIETATVATESMQDGQASPTESDVEYEEDDEDEDDECDPWPMTERELELRDQLLTFTDSVDTMHSFAKVTHPGINQFALDGVAWQIEDMLIGHVEMAYLIAKAQDYQGLKAWMEYYYSNTMPTPLDDNFKVNGGAGPSASSTIKGLTAKHCVSASKALEYLSQITEKVKAQSHVAKKNPLAAPPSAASRAASTSAAVQQAEKAVANVEQLGRDFIEQMQIVSKKRLPKRKL